MPRTRIWPATAAMWLGVCFASIAAPSSAAQAQEATSASPELASAIIRNVYRFDGGNVRVLNGRVPEDLANFYVPPGTRILGSVITGSSVRVFATTRAPVDSLRELFTRGLSPAGWRPFSWGSRGGFVEARRELPIMFCRDGAQLQVQRQPGTAGAHDLVLDYRDGMGPCDQSMGTATATATRGFSSEQTRFPTLYSPDDTSGSGRTRCFPRSGYRGETRTGTHVPATMNASELLRHYAQQLEAAGWRPSTPGGRQAAAGTWTLADTTGVKELTVEVVESSRAAAGCYDVQMGVRDRPR